MRRLRSLVGGAVFAGALLFGTAAQAQQGQGFSEQYPAVLTFENFGGIMYVRTKIGSSDAQGSTAAGTFLSLVPGAPLPQLGFHYFVAPPLSLGVGLHYSDVSHRGSAFEIEPRVGVAFPFESGTALWLRGGVTYFNYKDQLLGTEIQSGIAPGGEALLVLEPVDHFGFLVGARCLVSVGAKDKLESSSSTTTSDFSMIEAGFTVGVLSDF